MSKSHLIEALDLIALILPFLMITATFVGLAYIYGNAFTPCSAEASLDYLNIAYTHLP